MSLNNCIYKERREKCGLVETPQIKDWAGMCWFQQMKEGEGGWALAGKCWARNHARVCHQQYNSVISQSSLCLLLDFDRAPQIWMHFHLQPVNISSLFIWFSNYSLLLNTHIHPLHPVRSFLYLETGFSNFISQWWKNEITFPRDSGCYLNLGVIIFWRELWIMVK